MSQIYAALKEVRRLGQPFKNGTQITGQADVVAFDAYMTARAEARRLGATPYELQNAVHGIDTGSTFW